MVHCFALHNQTLAMQWQLQCALKTAYCALVMALSITACNDQNKQMAYGPMLLSNSVMNIRFTHDTDMTCTTLDARTPWI
eukprot:m.356426 g.356426  ORF g.356426 m.356426 type:complete len:80 (+) comp17541_c0_seq1:1268-1507(+)